MVPSSGAAPLLQATWVARAATAVMVRRPETLSERPQVRHESARDEALELVGLRVHLLGIHAIAREVGNEDTQQRDDQHAQLVRRHARGNGERALRELEGGAGGELDRVAAALRD